MKRRTGVILALAAAGTIAGVWVGVAVASNGDDNEAPITGDALTRAKAAALHSTGEGRVTETEVGDEDSYYEVEVTLNDGSQVDVQLDRDFNVVSVQGDSDHADDGSDD